MPGTPALPKFSVSELRGKTDFAILTIRDDEETALHGQFLPQGEVETSGPKGARWPYAVSFLQMQDGYYTVAMIRCLHQGHNQAQKIAGDIIEDLAPKWLLTVGIAGGFPDDEFTLGDVILSNYVYDLSVSSDNSDGTTEYAVSGGFLPKPVEQLLVSLAAKRQVVQGWGSVENIAPARPLVDPLNHKCYGDTFYRRKLRSSLKKHFVGPAVRGEPLYKVAPVISSNRLVKNPEIAAGWKRFSGRASAVEMEFGGVYSAARGRGVAGSDLPVLTVRGLSDIVGLERSSLWTTYACHSAAAFTRRLLEVGGILPLRTGPLPKPMHPTATSERVRFKIELATDDVAQALEWFIRASNEFSGDAQLIRVKD